ncbi:MULTISPECIES: outer membrane protein [Methylosinus]|uniref:Porin family protein n=1 Tax=Methylosinus trichosporium (strain ATCC 35070 / NCIMB 11131 / UNIQEM 75 / OB3b) TaxID=595536 RepID=A0A2D2CV50_METT3|nr:MULTISPECIES: outer membrane beta-barrel protein [Methylosinus]ATQ66702.1 porin family protein [Methylosinus trichosporium OB3b]OBS53371.1 outer-membrane immunogenic protein precursor [Methylosinus sp. 3S-1]
MKKYVVAASMLALAFGMGSASAADLPSRKDAPAFLPPPPPPPMWTGFYVGLNAGYGWTNNNTVTQSYADTGSAGFGAQALGGNFPWNASVSNDGFIGGGQIGYNAQVYNSFVVGLEADMQGVASDRQAASYYGPTASASISRSLDYLGTVRGRVGYLVTPTLLAYATGGLAYGQANLSGAYYGTATGSDSFSDTRVGYSVGGGFEWLFMPHWSAKAEYLYYDLGNATTPGASFAYTDGAGAQNSWAQSTARFDGHVVRAGVNYHFNFMGGEPSTVKY